MQAEVEFLSHHKHFPSIFNTKHFVGPLAGDPTFILLSHFLQGLQYTTQAVYPHKQSLFWQTSQVCTLTENNSSYPYHTIVTTHATVPP